MSGHRYWVSVRYGHVESSAGSVDDDHDYYENRPDLYTEVQAVPLDAIVIDGPLPEVTARERYTSTSEGCSWPSRTPPDEIEKRAREHLAIARHLREHPPVDERAVDELQDLLLEMGSDHARHIAHALLATGRVKVVNTDG